MDMRQMTREVRLEHWAGILQERQASGLSITAWCAANGVDRQRYFYWQRRLRELAGEAMELRAEGTVSPSKATEFVECQPALPEAGSTVRASSGSISQIDSQAAALVVHLPSGRVEIRSGADRETIENTLQAMRALC